MLHCWCDLVVKEGSERVKGRFSSKGMEIRHLKMAFEEHNRVIGELTIAIRL